MPQECLHPAPLACQVQLLLYHTKAVALLSLQLSTRTLASGHEFAIGPSAQEIETGLDENIQQFAVQAVFSPPAAISMADPLRYHQLWQHIPDILGAH